MLDLRLGNCVDIMQEMDFENIIIVSDPPFNIGYKYNSYKDRMKKEEYYNLLSKVFKDKKAVNNLNKEGER